MAKQKLDQGDGNQEGWEGWTFYNVVGVGLLKKMLFEQGPR